MHITVLPLADAVVLAAAFAQVAPVPNTRRAKSSSGEAIS
jgi:hypothetical protein